LVHVYERGQPVRMSGTALDVTERKHVEAVAARQAQQLSANERRLADAQEVGGLGSWEWDVATGSISWSDQMCRIYGHPPGLAPTFDEFVTMVHPSDRERVQRTISMALESRGVFQFDHRIVLPNGTERTLHARGGVDVDINGQPVTMRGTGQDVTEAKDSETALRHANSLLQELATTDTLTGLPNRALFSDRLDQALALGRREGRDVAVMFLDLDRFKDVNDSLGHDGGDELLVEVSRRLFGVLRDSDTVARLGGDEFGLLLSGPTTPEQAAFTAERVLECIRRSFTTGGREFFVSASIGIALWPEDCKSKAELLKHADVAMYRAKAAGGNRFEMFELAMTVAARDRLRVESELRQAIDHEELFLRYHPQIDLVTGDVVAVEGLVRWAHPSRGEVMPAEFISLAEDTGLIVPIGAWVLGEACRQAARWRREFADRPTLRMSVNVSARQLAHPGFVALVESALKESDMEPTDLELEITESVLIAESGPAVAALRSLRRLGVRLAIDDFGTGYSSLSYLRRFPVDRLKLDMSFVAGLSEANGPTQPGEGALVDAAINLGHALGLRALAEGVEDETQLRALIAYGCDEGQGYLWTKPLLAADLGAWLTARSAGLAAATAATALAAATAANALATVD
jgi:diguanylate cyclase (GGDEF)-like protein